MTPDEIIIAKLVEIHRFRQKRGLADMDYTILAVDR